MIEMQNISKAFSGNQVLKNVRFHIEQGEIHALMGENGAGKSTLMKILTGIYTRDTGEIRVKGNLVEFKNPKEAEQAGIAVIHQELNILPDLTVCENLFLGREKTFGKTGFLKISEMRKEAKVILTELGLDIDVDTPARRLSVGKQQIIEIAKALSTNAEVIIMDEPTAALTDREITTLFEMIRKLQAKGVSFVYISHRMEEIFAICDRITILRDGEYVATEYIKETSFEKVVKLMVGRELGERFPQRNAVIGEEKLVVTGLSRKGHFHDVSFTVHAGEVVGLAGLMGAGRTEVVQTLFGYHQPSKGSIHLDGKQVSILNPREAIRLGIGYVSEDRKTEGLITDFTIAENISLPNLGRLSINGIMRKEKEQSLVADMIERLSIRTSGGTQQVKSLSGGNQQKVVIAKWLGIEPQVLILDEPTRGVDVGAKKEIYSIMNALAERGVAIILVSSELPEIMGLTDRVLVLHEGLLKANINKQNMTQERIMHYATGGDQIA
ncbi:MAG: sugar ABC transporter ATP-binding protein [Bacilli bacterium]|nr:sugar ABC transporter ATP-binding protein [Bacilli bacterium]